MTLHNYTELVQGSEEWLAARLGIVTASIVGQLITPTLKVANNDTSRGVTLTLLAERITGHSEPVYVSDDMMRGQMDEPIARAYYAEHHAPVTETGFMVEDKWGFPIGYSPDGLVGDDGLIEIKSRKPKIQLNTILSGEPPAGNIAQMQAGMLVSGRKWCDYISWCGGLPPFVKRVHSSEKWRGAIVAAVEAFEADVAFKTEKYLALVEGLPAAERIDHNNVGLVF